MVPEHRTKSPVCNDGLISSYFMVTTIISFALASVEQAHRHAGLTESPTCTFRYTANTLPADVANSLSEPHSDAIRIHYRRSVPICIRADTPEAVEKLSSLRNSESNHQGLSLLEETSLLETMITLAFSLKNRPVCNRFHGV